MAANAHSAPRSPPSASNSGTSPTQHTSPLRSKVETATNNGVHTEFEEKLDLARHFNILDSEDYIEKYQKYEAEYTRRLMAKYFSKKNIYGGNIFEDKTTIDNETIMSSRWPGTRSFADPAQSFEDQNNEGSTSAADTPSNSTANKKHIPKKNG